MQFLVSPAKGRNRLKAGEGFGEILIFERRFFIMKTSIFAKLYNHRTAIFTVICAMLVVCAASAAFASEVSAGDNVPWDSGLDELVKVISGPTALYISMIGLFFAGGILIFGGELGNFTRMVMMVVLVGSTLTGIASLIAKFLNNGCVLY